MTPRPIQPMRTVLVVDDSALMRSVVSGCLTNEGHVVRTAEHGAEALELCHERRPDVILLDVEMPVLDGWATLAQLQESPELRQVPVILLSGRTDAQDVARGLRLGASDYLRKPFEEPELVARVRTAMRTRRLQDELRARNEELQRLATSDPLMGIGNRSFLEQQAGRVVARLRRHGGGLSVLMVDLDHFKQVNDEHGHATGDAVLVAVAGALAEAVREEDLLVRWGGEELVVLATDTVPPGAEQIAERVREVIAELGVTAPSGEAVQITASVGWASAEPSRAGAPSWRELLGAADRALYEAKAAGRDTIRGGILAPAEPAG